MRCSVAIAVACLSVAGMSLAGDVEAAIRRSTDIPAQGLGPALQLLAKAHGFQIVYVAGEVNSLRTQGASGELTSEEALTRLLSGTGLTFRSFGERAVSIVPIATGEVTSTRTDTVDRKDEPTTNKLRLAQNGQIAADGSERARQSEQQRATTLEEVIVTAERRSENAQRVPISMSVFSGDLQKQYLTTTSELANLVPNFQIDAFEGEIYSKATIRGLGATEQANPLVSNSVLTYYDGIASGTALASAMPLWDLDRIEVLRGPQGTLYGRNAVGGAIQYISAAPTETFEGFAQFTAGEFDLRRFEGALSGPISDNVRGRLSALVYDRGGDVHNTLLNVEQSQREWSGARAIVDWQVTRNLDVRVKGQHWEGEIDPLFFFLTPASRYSPADQTFAAAIGLDLDLNRRSNFEQGQHGMRDPLRRSEVDLAEIDVNHDFGPVLLTVVAGYLDAGMLTENAGQGYPAWSPAAREDMNATQRSVELRLTSQTDHPLQWIAGAYYQETEDSWLVGQDVTLIRDADGNRRSRGNPLTETDRFDGRVPALPFDALYQETLSEQELETYALFLHTTFDWTDRFTTTHAVRYTREEKDIGYIFASLFEFPTSFGVQSGTPAQFNDFIRFATLTPEQRRQQAVTIIDDPNTIDANGNVVLAPFGDAWEEVTWRLAADYRVGDDALLFASVSRGFKGGIFSVFVTPTTARSADPETSTVYEVGVKTQWWNDRIQLNASVFYDDHRGLQAVQRTIDPTTGLFVNQLDNLPEVEIYGGEIEMQLAPVDDLLIIANVGVLESEVTRVLVGSEALLGNEIPFAADLGFSGLVRYDVHTGLGTFSPQLSWRYRGEYWSTKENNDLTGKQGGFWTADVGLGFESPDSRLYAMLYWKNINDEVHPNIGGASAFTETKVNERRNWGLTVGSRF